MLLTTATAWAQTTETVSYIDADGNTQSVTATVLEGGGATTLATGWYVAKGTVTYTGMVDFDNCDIHLILADGATMNVGTVSAPISGSYGLAGDYANLTIYGQSLGTGALNVYTSGDDHAGIYVSALTINGGSVSADANGDRGSALYAFTDVTINGGTVSATGGNNGIYAGAAVNISGGTVTATGGIYGIWGEVTISGGTVTATGAYGIKAYREGSSYNFNVTISGGNVNASGTTSGIHADGDITLSGGTVNATGTTSGIHADGDITLSGGIVTATGTTAGIHADGDITLGWTRATDRITASSYDGQTVKITKPFTDGTNDYIGDEGNEWIYYGNLNADLDGATLFAAAPVSYIDEKGDEQTVAYKDYTILLGDPDGGAYLDEGTYVVWTNITYTGMVTLGGDVTLILTDGCTMNLGTSEEPISQHGIIGDNDATLTICGQSKGSGHLNIYCTSNENEDYSGISIRGDMTLNSGNVSIRINGGWGQGINASNNFTVNGGSLDIESESTAAYVVKAITINGGNVTANGVYGGLITNSGITINGGNVRATSTDTDNYGFEANNYITIGWTSPTDRIYASSYWINGSGQVTTKTGQTFTDGQSTYKGSLSNDDIAGKTLYPYIANLALAANGVTEEEVTNYWTTFYCGHTGYKIDDGENACAYTATYSSSTLTLHKLGKVIPKGNAVILVGEDNEISMTASTNAAENTVANNLHGVDLRTEKSTLGTGTFYVMGKVGTDFGFFQYTAQYMPARKAYLLINSGAAQVKGLTMVFDGSEDATSIQNSKLKIQNEEAGWYSLDGRRLDGKPTAKGIFIHNGRKEVLK